MKKSDYILKAPIWNEIPNSGLYLTQTVTLLQNYLLPFICNKDEKVITNTMINNYVKQGIINAPINKKYKRDDIASLFIICILKQVYSINDVKQLFELAFKKSKSNKIAYKYFCTALEDSIYITFNHKDQFDLNSKSKSKYILKNVTNSFASKLYVKRNYLEDS